MRKKRQEELEKIDRLRLLGVNFIDYINSKEFKNEWLFGITKMIRSHCEDYHPDTFNKIAKKIDSWLNSDISNSTNEYFFVINCHCFLIYGPYFEKPIRDMLEIVQRAAREYTNIKNPDEIWRHMTVCTSSDANWITDNQNVRKLAKILWEEKRFDEMPILSDALEESGCQDPIILNHFRCTLPHATPCNLISRLL